MIKLFESFETNEYYQEISESDANKIDSIKFDDSVKKRFSKLLDSLKSKSFNLTYNFDLALRKQGWPYGWRENNKEFLNINIVLKKEHYGFDVLPINDDDWFIVIVFNRSKNEYEFKYEYYKCDQYEGVIKLLKDKNCITPPPSKIKKFFNYFK